MLKCQQDAKQKQVDDEESEIVTTVEGRRRRRVRTSHGEWVFEEDLQKYENITTDHTLPSKPKVKKRQAYDPFKLISCHHYESDSVIPPFTVSVSSDVLSVIDVHSHLIKNEVIGLLGGLYNADTHQINISVAIPCNSTSSSIQCEMDPMSEVTAREVLSTMSLELVGWYHSHPAFAPNPSIRTVSHHLHSLASGDIENQTSYQLLCVRESGDEAFIGIICNPYNIATSLASQWNFVFISKDRDDVHDCSKPTCLNSHL